MDRPQKEIETYQASFILKALKDGWTVSMNDQGEFEFVKNKDALSIKEISRNDYSKKFLETYGVKKQQE